MKDYTQVERDNAAATIEEYAFGQMNMLRTLGDEDAANNLQEAINMAIAALREKQQRQPDPDTGLVPCGWCGPERIGWFSVQFWVRACYGKRKWMSVTQDWKKKVKYCPMCGRKLEGRQ